MGAHSFQVKQTEITRDMAATQGRLMGGELGAAMVAFSKNPSDAAAIAAMRRDPSANTLLYTTCVATLASAGHATNALPQRATANVNCRMWPGATKEETAAELAAVIGDPNVKITIPEVRGPPAKASPLSDTVMGPIRTLSQKHFPGVPVGASMSAGATDGQFLGNAGIPTYGVSGLFMTNENAGAHGLNEHVPVRSLYESRDFLYDLVKAYAPAR